MSPKTSPRMDTVMSLLIQHVHDFAREKKLTFDEWMQSVEFLTWASRMNGSNNSEGRLVCVVAGRESYVLQSNYGCLFELRLITKAMSRYDGDIMSKRSAEADEIAQQAQSQKLPLATMPHCQRTHPQCAVNTMEISHTYMDNVSARRVRG
jgi:hypothetical protein